MKQISFYICEICKTQYKERLAAKTCEESHVFPDKIADSRYLSKSQNEKGYPQSIDVLFKDGKTVRYHR